MEVPVELLIAAGTVAVSFGGMGMQIAALRREVDQRFKRKDDELSQMREDRLLDREEMNRELIRVRNAIHDLRNEMSHLPAEVVDLIDARHK